MHQGRGGEVRKGTENGVFSYEVVEFIIQVKEIESGYKVYLDFQDLEVRVIADIRMRGNPEIWV
jgi:hypothetical protein